MREPAILLVAHGSSDPEWRKPLDRVYAHVRELAPERPARLCFLERTAPDLETAVDELAREGIQRIRVVALLLSSTGRHFREDIPRLVQAAQQKHPSLKIELDEAAVGTHDVVIRAMARAAVGGDDAQQQQQQQQQQQRS